MSNSNGSNCSESTVNNAKRRSSVSPISSSSTPSNQFQFPQVNGNNLEVPQEYSSTISPRQGKLSPNRSKSPGFLKESAKIKANMTNSPKPPDTSISNRLQKKQQKPVGIASNARQKKFHRHFTQVDENEIVLNYYSCALIADILLQGHLYITKNHFAFYSNVFGYVTKLLIPTASVLKISKERTGRIFPNAVGIATGTEKHVFGSLLSRESTYNFLLDVWNSAVDQSEEEPSLPINNDKDLVNDVFETSVDDDSSSQTDNEISVTAKLNGPIKSLKPKCDTNESNGMSSSQQSATSSPIILKSHLSKISDQIRTWGSDFMKLPHLNQLLLASTILLLGLFISAGILLHRIDALQHNHISADQKGETLPKSDIYEELLKWQTKLHSKSNDEIGSVLQANLEQIAKIRQSLHTLSLLIAQSPKYENNVEEKSPN